MAVQAQYLPNSYRVPNNILDDFQQFQQQPENLGNSLFRDYNNYGIQPILNGTVYSGPESELTWNVSRKRNRNEHQHKFQFDDLPTLKFHNKTTPISTGFQISKAEHRLNDSQGTSTSGRLIKVSPPSEPLTQDLASYICQQNLEMDAFIQLQNEKLGLVVEGMRKRHCRSLLLALEQQEVLKRLKEKEMEMDNVKRKNAELEDKVKQMSAENQIWFDVAKNNEAIVLSLKSTIKQILVEAKEGFGDSNGIGVLADDAESCCYEGGSNDDVAENHQLKHRKACKVCRENDVSVLLLPCRHLCLCKECESKLDSCPICHSTKNASLQIFMS